MKIRTIIGILILLLILSMSIYAADVVFDGGRLSAGGLDVNLNTFFVNESNGNVGIGTRTPEQELHIESSDPMLVFRNSISDNQANTGKIFFSETNLAGMIMHYDGSSSKNYLAFIDRTSGLDSIRTVFTRTGNVGIGTINPQTKLDVNGTVSATGLKLNSAATVNSIETTITDSTTAIPTSSAVIDLLAGGGSNTSSVSFVGADTVGNSTTSDSETKLCEVVIPADTVTTGVIVMAQLSLNSHAVIASGMNTFRLRIGQNASISNNPIVATQPITFISDRNFIFGGNIITYNSNSTWTETNYVQITGYGYDNVAEAICSNLVVMGV